MPEKLQNSFAMLTYYNMHFNTSKPFFQKTIHFYFFSAQNIRQNVLQSDFPHFFA